MQQTTSLIYSVLIAHTYYILCDYKRRAKFKSQQLICMCTHAHTHARTHREMSCIALPVTFTQTTATFVMQLTFGCLCIYLNNSTVNWRPLIRPFKRRCPWRQPSSDYRHQCATDKCWNCYALMFSCYVVTIYRRILFT